MSIKTILNNKDAVSLLLLSQINFAAGLDMMKRLKADKLKRAGKNEQDIHPDQSVADDFADMMPQVQEAPELDISVNLVGASLVLASEITQEDAQFLKTNILSPKAIIIKQMDWTANREAMQRLATASKFGLQVSVDKFLADIKAKQQEPIAEFTIEAQSALKPGLKAMEARHLIHLIEESYHRTDWMDKLKDSAISLFEGARKRIEDGKFADLPDEVVIFARQALEERQAA